MSREFVMSRYEAEMIVDLAEAEIKRASPNYDLRMLWLADDIRAEWGMGSGLGARYPRWRAPESERQ